ncbi:MAG: hypothetical protein AVDCRST_MAG66-2987, partial [uncultured Pseudonocardia sp.]
GRCRGRRRPRSPAQDPGQLGAPPASPALPTWCVGSGRRGVAGV